MWLSKSQINTFISCPYRWKLQYIDKKEEPKGPALWRGIEVHKKIEKFYKSAEGLLREEENVKFEMIETGQKNFRNFLGFARRRFNESIIGVKFEKKYFLPIATELDLTNQELRLRGIVDAIFLNPEDNEYIIMDWKTGKYFPDFSKFRKELAVYKLLIDKSGIFSKPIKYWAMYFLDFDKLFFEECKDVSIKALFKTIDKIRTQIELYQKEGFPCNPSVFCRWCGFFKDCDMGAGGLIKNVRS